MYLKFPFYCFIVTLFLASPAFSAQSYEELLEEQEYSDYDTYENDFTSLHKAANETSSNGYAPMANLEGEPNAYVHGCVNVITGQYCEFQTDLVVHHGVDPIHFDRSFAGNRNLGSMIGYGWFSNHSSYLYRNPDCGPVFLGESIFRQINKTSLNYNRYADDHGAMPLVFEEDSSNPSNCIPRHQELFKGVTNTSQGIMSGQTNLRNLKFFYVGENPHVKTGNGSVREFFYPSKSSKMYHIKTDTSATGNKWVYGFTKHTYDFLTTINLYNQDNVLAGYMRLENNSLKGLKKRRPLIVKTNDGRFVQYNYEKINKDVNVLRSVESSDRPTVKYFYNFIYQGLDLACRLISQKTLPEKRTMQISYYDTGKNTTLGHTFDFTNNPKDPRVYRVQALYEPVGTDSVLHATYLFIHNLYTVNIGGRQEVLHGSCDVYNALRHRTQYGFNADHRLSCINKFSSNGHPYTHERLFWGNNLSKDTTCLIARDLMHAGSTVFARSYEYDKNGNVLVDSLFGNLTGHNETSPIVLENGSVVENGSDCYRKHQTYSDDGLNLLLMENDGFQLIVYTYEPGTNRLIAKFTGTESQWLERSFYFYNEDAAIVKEITDDGFQLDYRDLSGVSERKIIDYTQSKVYPVAYPLVIEEKCLDLETGQEKLIHKVVNTYTNLAKISKQDHYGSDGKYAYSLHWEYDNRGNITKEVNEIGQATIRQYDANNNCTFEQRGNKFSYKKFTYDFMNRLINEHETFADRETRITSHRYDASNNRIATVDPNGNETTFKYDAFGRLIETTYPPTLNEDKIPCFPIVKREYNVMSNLTKEINANGVEKQMKYTVRGQLAEVIYPDGSTEKNTYYLNGLLKESETRNHTVTKYTYDAIKRPISAEIYDEQGTLLSTIRKTYQGSRLIAETDATGAVTAYTHYPDGKVKSKQKGEHTITFTYDTWGRECKTVEQYGPDSTDVIVKIKDYDALNRIVWEMIQDDLGALISKLDYTYDVQGNICQTVQYNQSGINITKKFYDCHNTLYSLTDAKGNVTNSRNFYHYKNESGQVVSYQEITDPKGNMSIIIGDVLGRTVLNLRKNPFGKITQKQESTYDLVGNLCSITDTVISEGESDREIKSIMQYDSCNRLTKCFEAYGTPEQKVTKITYNHYGQKETLIKNDGISLIHTYDVLGRLQSLCSSDSTIHYTYEYDLNDNPIEVKDEIHGIATIRNYDSHGFMIGEKLGNHLAMTYQQDGMGRTNKMVLPDGSGIEYNYHANLLKNVNRVDASNQLQYSHNYETYDFSGNLTKSILPLNTGTLNFEYDILGRLKTASLDTKGWKEHIKEYDSVGNIIELEWNDGFEETSLLYSYDDLYQLTGETGARPHSYTYDSHYNRRTKDGSQLSLNSLHQLTDDGINTYTYDLNGNILEKQSQEQKTTFVYDALDRLVTFFKDDQKIIYLYDESNRRLSKTIFTLQPDALYHQEKTIRYLYHGQNEIGAVDEHDKIIELRVLGLGKGAEIGAAVALEFNKNTFIPLHDHIGNVSCLLDGTTGEIADTYHYSSFGEELFDGHTAISPWRFASKRTDEESGLVYFGRRYYDAETGRWITLDPIGRDGGPNLYAYVLNSPMTHFDLHGLFGMESIRSGIGYLVGMIGNTLSPILSSFAQASGIIMSNLSREFLPLPYVQELVDFGGWCLQGENPSQYNWDQFQSKFLLYKGSESGNPNDIFAMTNGIATTEVEFTKRMAELSHLNGDIDVYGLYTGCRGTIYDLCEAACQKIGIPTYGQQLANKAMYWLLDQQGERRDQTTVFTEAHSRGNETIYHFDAPIREKMKVTGFGPARIASREHFSDSQYYISPLDVVPLLSPYGLYKGIKNGNVHYLPTNGNPVSDHLYDNKHFDKVRRDSSTEYRKSLQGTKR